MPEHNSQSHTHMRARTHARTQREEEMMSKTIWHEVEGGKNAFHRERDESA